MLQQNISQNQQQMLSVDQRQSLQILAYTNQELDAFLTEEYMQNPLMECKRDRQSEIIDSLDGHYEYASSYKDHYIRYEEEDSDRRGDIRAKEPSSLRHQLTGQLSAKDYSAEEWKLVDYLIECLDDKGFFPYENEEIASAYGCSADMVEKCLQDLKTLEPAGIFAKDISECLLRQLEVRQEKDEVLFRIISDYLSNLLQGNLSTITRSLGISTAKCRSCIQKIGELNPRPIMNTESGQTQYIVPDILVSRAIRNKYIQYRRPLLLRDLFSNAASVSTDASADLVRKRIEELVRNEDRSHPLSDDKIARALKAEGLTVSRRTVAKYRQQQGIPDSRLRAYL